MEKFKEAPLGESAEASPWGVLVDSLPADMKDVARLAILNFAEFSRDVLAKHPLNMTTGDGSATLLTIGPDVTVAWPGAADEPPGLPDAGAIQVNPAGMSAFKMDATVAQLPHGRPTPANGSGLALP